MAKPEELRTTRSTADLVEASKHLLYELDMFEDTAEALTVAFLRQPRLPPLQRRALLESFTVHARALLHVFYPDSDTGRPQTDDVLAADFFDGAEAEAWRGVGRMIPADLADTHKRVNKQIAHLTYSRLDVSDDKWNWYIGRMRLAMRPVVAEFANAVPPERLHDGWAKWRTPFGVPLSILAAGAATRAVSAGTSSGGGPVQSVELGVASNVHVDGFDPSTVASTPGTNAAYGGKPE